MPKEDAPLIFNGSSYMTIKGLYTVPPVLYGITLDIFFIALIISNAIIAIILFHINLLKRKQEEDWQTILLQFLISLGIY